MEHPLIGDISHLTQEQLSQAVSDLQKSETIILTNFLSNFEIFLVIKS